MIDIAPNRSRLPGIAQLRDIVGAVMTVGLFLSVLALIISAIVWGFGANSSNPHLASRGKTGCWPRAVPRPCAERRSR
ncbi:DUF6112 family protein [Micromonospora echinospora]|uniref:DUF6112 family protein n=1 Tax=Micromonospora echinospora TaxID=1877 RepID=UPI003F4D3E86